VSTWIGAWPFADATPPPNLAPPPTRQPPQPPLPTSTQHHTHLRTLNLADNTLGARGCYAVAEMLALNEVIDTLGLAHNALLNDAHDMGGFAALADALAVNDSLTSIDMSWNRLTGTGYCATSSGIDRLAAALGENNTLQELNLENNYVDLEGQEMMAAVCATKHVDLKIKNRSELG